MGGSTVGSRERGFCRGDLNLATWSNRPEGAAAPISLRSRLPAGSIQRGNRCSMDDRVRWRRR